MADEKPTLHIDDDWKRQAQQEKRRLAEEESRAAKQSATLSAPSAANAGIAAAPQRAAATAGPAGKAAAGAPAAGMASLVQSLMTQIFYYLGDLGTRGGESAVNLDMAKYQLDTLNVLEEKTKGNLTPEEKTLMDTALYETRMRYVSVASQYL